MENFDLSTYVAAFKRRWWLLLTPVVLLTPLALGLAYILPPVYAATARVAIEAPQIPTELAASTVTIDVAQRLALIEQQLMTRRNLLELARKHDVFADRPGLSPGEIVELMRESTRIGASRLENNRGPIIGVNISFTASDARIAADVTNELLQLLLDQNLQQRNTRAFATSGYFRQEVDRLSQELADLEKRITDFKIENRDALPDSLEFRRQELANLEQRSFERELRLIQLQDQREQVDDAIRRGDYGLFGTRAALSPTERQLQELRQTLLSQRTVYSESHPRIRSLVARIAALEGSLAPGEGEENGDEVGAGRANRAIEEIDKQIAALREQIASDEERGEALQGSIGRTPNVELQLGELQRRYDALKTQHQQAVLKLAEAETGERLEVTQKSERWEVIEQAVVPTAPESPNRPLIAGGGAVLSIALGIGLVVLLELLNRSIRTPADMERALDLRPVVTIPYIETPREVRTRVWRLRAVLILILVVTPALLFAIDQLYLPLPVVAERLMKTSGLDNLLAMIDARL